MLNKIKYPTIAIIGNGLTGKSSYCKNIMEYFSDDIFVIISETEKLKPFYSNFTRDIFIYKEYDSNVIDKIIKYNKKCSAWIVLDSCYNLDKKDITKLLDKSNKTKSIIVFDKIIDEVDYNKFDYILLTHCDMDFQKKIHEIVVKKNFNQFSSIFKSCIDNNKLLVINNNILMYFD
jgi:hypothetical protein